jgi:GNAT superfamily N-acetyltransferase
MAVHNISESARRSETYTERQGVTSLSVRPKTEADDARVVSLRNRISDHLPGMSVEAYRHFERIDRLVEHAHDERYVAERDGEIVGLLNLELIWWTKKPGGFYASVFVEPEVWGQGIGAALYDLLMERLRDLDADRVYANVRIDRPAALKFVEERGFVKTGHSDRWSRLPVAKANLDGYTGVEERLASEGIEIVTLADRGDDEAFLRSVHAMNDEAIADIPSSEEFSGSTPFEMFLEELKSPDMSLDRAWVAVEGDHPVGIAILPMRDQDAFNGFTGTARSVRGRGVARALKLKTIEWSRANGITYIYTANDINNARMLSINNSLGYEVLPRADEFVKEVN